MTSFTRTKAASVSGLLAAAIVVTSGVSAHATITPGAPIDIDTGANRQIDAYQVVFSPTAPATKAYTFNGLDDTVVVINPTDGAVESTISLDANVVPAAVAFTPDGTLAFTANFGDGSTTVIDTNDDSIVGSVDVPGDPYDVTISPDGRFAAFSCYHGNSIKVMSTNSFNIVKTYRLRGSGVWQARFTPNGKRIYAVANDEGVVIVIDTAKKKVIKKIPLVGLPWWLEVSPDGKEILVTDYIDGDSTVDVINVKKNKVVARIDVGTSVYGLAYDRSDGEHAYVTNDTTRVVSVIDTSTREVVDTFTATGTRVLVPTINPAGTLGYVGDRYGLITTFTPY
jgi:YVTN family beta-propeller protein